MNGKLQKESKNNHPILRCVLSTCATRYRFAYSWFNSRKYLALCSSRFWISKRIRWEMAEWYIGYNVPFTVYQFTKFAISSAISKSIFLRVVSCHHYFGWTQIPLYYLTVYSSEWNMQISQRSIWKYIFFNNMHNV